MFSELSSAKGPRYPCFGLLEVGNILLLAQRRRLLDAAARRDHLKDLAQLPINVDQETAHRAWRDTSLLAERHSLTLYDAAYLELSLRRQPATGDLRCGIAASR